MHGVLDIWANRIAQGYYGDPILMEGYIFHTFS